MKNILYLICIPYMFLFSCSLFKPTHLANGQNYLKENKNDSAIIEFELAFHDSSETVDYRVQACNFLSDIYLSNGEVNKSLETLKQGIGIITNRLDQIDKEKAQAAVSMNMQKVNDLQLETIDLGQLYKSEVKKHDTIVMKINSGK